MPTDEDMKLVGKKKNIYDYPEVYVIPGAA